jgi:hypothetical protein
MRSNEIFQYYLCDYPGTGNFYVDVNGMIQTTNMPTPLKFAPGGWMDTELKFARSEHYYGINRSYSIPLKFVGDGAAIIRHVFYTGRGIEQLLQLIVLKWQPADMTLPDGTFRPGDSWYLYYKGLLDLPKMKDKVQEGIEVNIMEGGVVQLLKAYENAVFEIPCDGSIPENIKVNVDGILLNDVFHYSFLNCKPTDPGVLVIPAVFQGNDGDNIGITHNDPNLEQPTGAGLTYFQSSQNFLFSSIFGTTVRITGSIVVQADWRQPSTFYLYTTTNESQPVGSGVTRSVGLVKQQTPPSGGHFTPLPSQVTVTGEMIFNFDITQPLDPNENLFLLFFNEFANFPITIVGGNFDITFSSRYQASRVWGITAWDLFQLIIGQINQLASNFLQTYNFGAVSSYLQEKLNWVYTSGDALRASTDPNYFQYYNNKTLNVANPNAQLYNQFQSLGPVIKISLRDFFDDLNPVGNASLSNIKLAGQPEAIFFERKEFVYDTSAVTLALGEVADFEIEPYYDGFFNWLRIGWPNPSLDQKQGKFAYNTTAQWQLPIKTVPKVMDIISKANTDPYLIEYTRFNPTGGVSTTNNNNDNSRFLLNVDFGSFILDFYSAIFTSIVQNTSNPANTNYELTFNVNMQGIFAPTLNGEYFVADNQPTIFVFNQNISGLPFTLNVSFQALVNGLLTTDSTTIRMWINGIVVRTWSQIVTGSNTPFNITEPAFIHNFSLGDSIWFTIDTTPTGTVQIGTMTLAVSDGSGNYFTATLAGLFNVNTGSIQTLIPLSTVVARQVAHIDPNVHPVVSYGFQYFRFIDVINNPEFTLTMVIAGLLQGGTTNTAAFDLYYNGTNIGHISYPGTSSQTSFGDPVNPVFTQNITFGLYDIVWALGSATNLAVWVTNFNLTFTSSIKAYNLLRKTYDNISGIPNPTTAYNIEEFTPGRMLRTWGNWLRSITNNLIPDKFTFQEINKNQFLSTTLNGVTITENQNINISDFDPALFLGVIFRFKTQVPLNFADILNGAANGYIQFSYLGNIYYGFPLEVSQKPSLNDTQEWTLLASPQNQLSQFVDLNFDGLNPNYLNLVANQIFIAHTCPLQFVPNGITKNPQYNFVHMDDDWYINQVNFWTFKENYFQKWQLNDTIPIQILTNSIGSANVLVYLCTAPGKTQLVATIPMTVVMGSPLQAPYIQLEATINPVALGLSTKVYYVVIQAGGATPVISEGIQFATTWPVSLLLQYSNSSNKQSTVWSTGYRGAFRAEGWIDDFSAESKFTTYEDQPADITLLNAIPYRKFRLNISAPRGVPDWVWDKVKRIMLLDTVTIDGHAYTLEEGAKAEVKKTDSWPKRYWSIEIREAKNSEGVTYDASGVVVSPVVVASIDLNAFQENPIGPPNLIQVTQS